MGYLLAFARSMQLSAKKNQLNLQQTLTQIRQERINNDLAMLQQMANSLPEGSEDSPERQNLEFQKQILTAISNSLSTRLQTLQTELAQVSAEEHSIYGDRGDGLSSQIQASAPKYVV